MHHSASVATRLRRGIDRVINRTFTLSLLVWLTCKPAFADLPTVEAPTSGGGSGLMEELVRRAGEAGMESGDQVFNVGWFDLMRKSKYPEVMNEYPLRVFFRRLSRECKFTITPHRFRHTVATHMMKSPERNLYAVKKLLGHVSITSTLEYIDESVDSLRDILETELM